MTETARMREIRDELQRLELADPTDCQACRAAWAAHEARIEGLTAEWHVLHKAACADDPCRYCARQGELPDAEWDALTAGE